MSIMVFVSGDSGAVSVGADDVALEIQQQAEQRGVDVKIVRTSARGMYWLEPLVEVQTGNKRAGYGPIEASDVASLFEANFEQGQPHASFVGPVEEIPFLARQNRQIFARAGKTQPLDLPDYIRTGGFKALKKALDMRPEVIIEQVQVSGLRGRGGAGFPAGIKWKTVADQNAVQKYICCNADEGDSGTFADRMFMEGDPFALIEAMVIAGFATGANKGLIYVRSEYPAAIKTLKSAIHILHDAGWLGETINGSSFSFNVEVRRGAGSYVCGEESAMLESLEGKRGQVRVKPPIPAISGLFGKPTLVHNVLTLASIPAIITGGAKTYESLGHQRSRGTQAFQLAGNIKQGGLIEVPFGVTLRELVEDFGGGTASGKPFKCAQLGGPLGAYANTLMLDVAMDYESLSEADLMLGHGGIVVFDGSANMGELARFAFEFCAIESCGKCTPCRIGSVRGVETVDKILAGTDTKNNVALLHDLCAIMEEGSLCAMGGLTPLPVLSALKLFPQDFGLPAPSDSE